MNLNITKLHWGWTKHVNGVLLYCRCGRKCMVFSWETCTYPCTLNHSFSIYLPISLSLYLSLLFPITVICFYFNMIVYFRSCVFSGPSRPGWGIQRKPHWNCYPILPSVLLYSQICFRFQQVCSFYPFFTSSFLFFYMLSFALKKHSYTSNHISFTNYISSSSPSFYAYFTHWWIVHQNQ